MRRPPSLIGRNAGGSYFVSGWELRVTGRCLDEDLNADATSCFEQVAGLEIVRALVRERSDKTHGGRQVNPIACGCEVWVVAHGNDHRGATIFDADEEVVWLVAYRRHRSGSGDDFFPYCKAVAEDERLLPTDDDYARLHRERDRRFADAIAVEAPQILREARQTPGEHEFKLAGEIDASIAIEVIDDPEAMAISVAFTFDAVSWDQVPAMLAALHPGQWEGVDRMPSRELRPGEVAMTLVV